MTESEHLREQAARCLRLARSALASDVAQSMLKLASDYLALAREVEKAEPRGQRQQSGDTLFTQFKQQNYVELGHHQWKTPLAVRPVFL